MAISIRSLTPVRLVLAMILILPAAALASCREGEEPARTTTAQRATGPILSLAPRREWRRLGAEAGFLVSPLVSPSGRHVAVRGRGGRGLFLLAPGLRVLDPGYRGPVAWVEAPERGEEVLLWEGSEGMRAFRTGKNVVTSGSRRSWEKPWDETLGRRLLVSAQGAWWHHPRRGTVTWVDEASGSLAVAEHDAWGVVVSPDAQRVAWSTGTLASSTLRVFDRATGRTLSPGPGAYPAWLPESAGSPGSRYLVFAAVHRVDCLGGRGEVMDSDLHLLDARSGAHRVLARTRGVAEMEPRPTPDGRALIFSDWREGAIYRAALVREGGR